MKIVAELLLQNLKEFENEAAVASFIPTLVGNLLLQISKTPAAQTGLWFIAILSETLDKQLWLQLINALTK